MLCSGLVWLGIGSSLCERVYVCTLHAPTSMRMTSSGYLVFRNVLWKNVEWCKCSLLCQHGIWISLFRVEPSRRRLPVQQPAFPHNHPFPLLSLSLSNSLSNSLSYSLLLSSSLPSFFVGRCSNFIVLVQVNADADTKAGDAGFPSFGVSPYISIVKVSSVT
jgi:hypothetical protein